MKRIKKNLFIALGFLSLALGALGIILPVLPTTPFVLLASVLFSSAHPALAKKLENSRYFGEFIRNYRAGGGVSRSVKVRALAFLYLTLALSFYFSKPIYARVILVAVAAGVTLHILRMKTKKD